MIQFIERRRKINQLCNSVKSNHKIVNYDKINAIFTELLGPISYASNSKNVFTEQYFLLVVTEKKDQTNLYSLPTFHGGICNGV